MKQFLLLITTAITLSFNLPHSVPADELLEWKATVALTWSDFKGEPDNTVDYKAMTYSRIALEAEFEENAFIVDVKTYFLKNKSWTKNNESKTLLKHEQVHFDIAELIARKIRKAYSEYESTDLQETQKFLQQTYNEYYGPVWDSYNVYDDETNHGVNTDEQKSWEKKIAKELAALSRYSSSQVKIPFKGKL